VEIKKLDTKIFLIALFVLGLALLVAYSILDKPVHSPFYDWWQVVKYRDRVQKEYGLTIREIKIHWPEYDREVTCFAVASVKPGGKAEKLGFKVGDIFLRKVKSLSGNRTQSRARRRASRTRRPTEVRLVCLSKEDNTVMRSPPSAPFGTGLTARLALSARSSDAPDIGLRSLPRHSHPTATVAAISYFRIGSKTHGRFPEEGQIYWGFADSDSMPGFSWSVINDNDISKDYKERIREVELKER